MGKSKNDLQGLYFLRKNRVIDFGGWFELGEKNADRFWNLNERFNRLRVEINIPVETSKDWINSSKTKVNIPDYAVSKIRKSLIKIRKDYLEKINQMEDNESESEAIDEKFKRKKELIKMLKSKIFTDEELSKIEALIK